MSKTLFAYSTEHYRKPSTAQRLGLELQMNIKYDNKNEFHTTNNRIEENTIEMIAD